MEIARRFQLSDAHVRLAPDIVEAIVEGRQPRSLTVKNSLRLGRPARRIRLCSLNFLTSAPIMAPLYNNDVRTLGTDC